VTEIRLFGEVRLMPEALENADGVSRFRELLVERGGMDPAEARGLVSELIGYMCEDLGSLIGDALRGDLEALIDLRSEVTSRYRETLELFGGGRGAAGELPERLRPEALRSLFDQIESRLEGIESPEELINGVPQDSPLLAGFEDVLPRPGEGESPVVDRTSEPGSVLDETPVPREWFPSNYEQQRVELDYYREALRDLEDPQQRARAEAAAQAVASRYGFPPDWRVTIRRIPEYGYTLEQILALAERDPTFAGEGYEVVIRVPEGTAWAPRGRTFAPDGVQMGGRGFRFLEYKTSFAPEPAGFYNTEGGAQALLADMEMRARMSLEIPGCDGWSYHTGQGWLDVRIGDLVSRFELEHPDLAGLIHAPAGGVE
jgi:hypothetical protein